MTVNQPPSIATILERITEALEAASRVAHNFMASDLEVRFKQGDDPLTEADLAINRVLQSILPRADEGWLSEETADNPARLEKRAIWIVDPIDGTREFVTGIPEWGISIGYIHEGQAIAGGICNPATGETIIGSLETGVLYNGESACVSRRESLNGAVVLASRSEIKRGEWESFATTGLTIQPMGSVAYKLALVAAGRADATWTLVPKSEWDVAAGVALVRAAGGFVREKSGEPLQFNCKRPLLTGLIAGPMHLQPTIETLLGIASN